MIAYIINVLNPYKTATYKINIIKYLLLAISNNWRNYPKLSVLTKCGDKMWPTYKV